MVEGGILVIDDDVLVRRAWDRWLRSRGVAYWCVGTADEARAVFERELILAVISDFHLATETSAEVLRELRASTRPPVIVVLTADPEDARHHLGLGWAILQKPIDPSDVISALEGQRPG